MTESQHFSMFFSEKKHRKSWGHIKMLGLCHFCLHFSEFGYVPYFFYVPKFFQVFRWTCLLTIINKEDICNFFQNISEKNTTPKKGHKFFKKSYFVRCYNLFISVGSHTLQNLPYLFFLMPCYFWSEFVNSAHSGLQSALHFNLAIRTEFRIELDVLSIYSKICP